MVRCCPPENEDRTRGAVFAWVLYGLVAVMAVLAGTWWLAHRHHAAIHSRLRGEHRPTAEELPSHRLASSLPDRG
jgi:hypothetical protein